MIDIMEAFRIMDDLVDEDEKHQIITIETIVTPTMHENLPSGNINDIYDEQTLDEWYDFAGTVEGIIDNMCDIVNISLSKNPNSLSEYIDFYIIDENGNRKNYLIDLRLSDHSITTSGKENRKRYVQKIDKNYEFTSITINNKSTRFETYHDAIIHLRRLIADRFMNDR